jgi:hypothetical protein
VHYDAGHGLHPHEEPEGWPSLRQSFPEKPLGRIGGQGILSQSSPKKKKVLLVPWQYPCSVIREGYVGKSVDERTRTNAEFSGWESCHFPQAEFSALEAPTGIC